MKVINATFKVMVHVEFDDDESTEQTVRYLLEQDLRDNGWDVDVEVDE